LDPHTVRFPLAVVQIIREFRQFFCGFAKADGGLLPYRWHDFRIDVVHQPLGFLLHFVDCLADLLAQVVHGGAAIRFLLLGFHGHSLQV
jgi:hypothetical protein